MTDRCSTAKQDWREFRADEKVENRQTEGESFITEQNREKFFLGSKKNIGQTKALDAEEATSFCKSWKVEK